MKILIDKIGKTLKELIKEKADLYEIPSCFGNMGQSILYNTLDIAEDCVRPINMIKEEERDIFLNKVLDETLPNLDATKYCITKEGAEYISKEKDILIEEYIKKLLRCNKCKFFERCSNITTHSLKRVELDLIYNNK